MRISGPEGNWERVRADLAEHTHTVLHARTEDWAASATQPHPHPHQTERPSLRALLGGDWDRYLTLRHPDARARFTASRLLLKHAVAAVVQVPPQDVELGYTAAGRPYLRGYDAVQISLSHTGNLLLVGMATGGVIGVDAERSDRPLYGPPGLSRHLCTPYEAAAVEALPLRERDAALVRLWTLKEAYSKAIGLGLGARFTEFGFGPAGRHRTHSTHTTRLCLPDGTPVQGSGNEWAFRTCLVEGRYTAGIAVADAGFGPTADIAAATALDPVIVGALLDALECDAADATGRAPSPYNPD